jgi:hypothetical protein
MAITVSSLKLPGLEPQFEGQVRSSTREWTLTGTYTAGGYLYVPTADLGLSTIVEVEFPDALFRSGATFIVPWWDRVAKKVMFAWTGAALSGAFAEVTAAATLTGFVGRVRARGY